jgi:cytochrome c-type biogenesis protein CcmH
MIYVKAARGRPMPIAIQKIQLKDFTGVVIALPNLLDTKRLMNLH